MGDLLQPTHLLVIGILLLILFGAKRLPELGRGLGDGLRSFKDGIRGLAAPSSSPVQESSVVSANPVPIQPQYETTEGHPDSGASSIKL